MTDNTGILNGTRILDLGRVLAGPFCAQILGDMGAEIIKVERPDGGDDTRAWKPPTVGGEAAYFFSVNRNKKSVTLDLSSPEGQPAALRSGKGIGCSRREFSPGRHQAFGHRLRRRLGGQSEANLLLDIGLRARRRDGAPRGIRLCGAGDGRADVDYRRTGRHAGSLRRRRGRLSDRTMGDDFHSRGVDGAAADGSRTAHRFVDARLYPAVDESHGHAIPCLRQAAATARQRAQQHRADACLRNGGCAA